MLSAEQLQRLYRYGYSLTAHEAAAYDLLQDALESYLRTPPRAPAATESYLRSTMRNRFIDQLRRAQRFPSESYDDGADAAVDFDVHTLEDLAIAELDLDTVWRLLDPYDREILYLWAVDDLSTREISETLSVPRGTILARIHRMRRHLEKELATRPATAGVGLP